MDSPEVTTTEAPIPSEPVDKDKQIADLTTRLDSIQREAQLAINSLTRQRNQAFDQITRLEIDLALKG